MRTAHATNLSIPDVAPARPRDPWSRGSPKTPAVLTAFSMARVTTNALSARADTASVE